MIVMITTGATTVTSSAQLFYHIFTFAAATIFHLEEHSISHIFVVIVLLIWLDPDYSK
jgi:hypothetical protein